MVSNNINRVVFSFHLVDDFREVAQLMLKTHKFGGQVMTKGRVEFLPVHWHSALLENDADVDK